MKPSDESRLMSIILPGNSPGITKEPSTPPNFGICSEPLIEAGVLGSLVTTGSPIGCWIIGVILSKQGIRTAIGCRPCHPAGRPNPTYRF